MDTIVIGVGVKAKNGKDTVVEHLIQTYKGKYDIRRYAFGDAMKVELYDALLDPAHEYWKTTDEYSTLPRPTIRECSRQEKLDWVVVNKLTLVKHMQLYGTEFRRTQDPFYWVRLLAKQIKQEAPQIAMIADVRFRNEWLWVKAQKGFTVRCVRLGFIDPSRNASHPSETELDNAIFDWSIEVPDGAVDELRSDAVSVFESIVKIMTPEIPEVCDGIVAA